MIVMIVFLLMFAHIFFLRLGEKDDFDFHDAGQDSPFSPVYQTLQTMYTLAFLGDYDNDFFPSPVDVRRDLLVCTRAHHTCGVSGQRTLARSCFDERNF